MTAHDPQILSGSSGQLRHTSRDPRVRESVKAIAAQSPALSPVCGQRIGGGSFRQSGVEGGVEARDRGQLWQRFRDGVERREGLGLVKRREIDQLSHRRLDVRVDPHSLAEALASMDDAVADGVGFAQARVKRCTELTQVHL